jgi:hypothetical protein
MIKKNKIFLWFFNKERKKQTNKGEGGMSDSCVVKYLYIFCGVFTVSCIAFYVSLRHNKKLAKDAIVLSLMFLAFSVNMLFILVPYCELAVKVITFTLSMLLMILAIKYTPPLH